MNKWFVVNDYGEVAAHDIGEIKAKTIASVMQEEDPDAGWEAINGDEIF